MDTDEINIKIEFTSKELAQLRAHLAKPMIENSLQYDLTEKIFELKGAEPISTRRLYTAGYPSIKALRVGFVSYLFLSLVMIFMGFITNFKDILGWTLITGIMILFTLLLGYKYFVSRSSLYKIMKSLVCGEVDTNV